MSQMPPAESLPASAPPVDGESGRRRRAVPIWLWILLAGVVLVILIMIAIPLFSRGAGGIAGTPSPSASSDQSSTPTPSATASPSPTPSPSPSRTDVGQGTFSNDIRGFMPDVLNSQQTSVLAQGGTFSNPVHVLAANSGVNTDMTPNDAVGAMAFMFTPMDPHPWNFSPSTSVLESYRDGPYGDYFPAGAIVATSHDGHVFSFIGHDSTITTMFMAASEDLLH